MMVIYCHFEAILIRKPNMINNCVCVEEMNNMYVYILDPKRNKMIFANTQIQPKDWAYKPQVKNKFFACIITKAWISKEGICGHLGCKEGGGGGGLCIYRMFHHVSNSINILICLKIFDTKFIKTITVIPWFVASPHVKV